MTKRVGIGIGVLGWCMLADTGHAGPPPRHYTVKAGDSCLSIAARELGAASAYKIIHTLNPSLGPEPHTLRSGTVLVLPAIEPDAQIAATLGTVEVRKPEQTLWSAAARGVELFRAWRVKTERRAVANVAFPDTTELTLREESVLIVYGPTKSKTKTLRASAELQTGSLQARLAELDAPPLLIATPAGEAEVADGSAIVRLDAQRGHQAVSNLGGRDMIVRGISTTKRARGPKSTSAVSVPAGMGTKVIAGQAPMPPRPLPAPPELAAISPTTVFALEGRGLLLLRWTPTTGVANYLVSLARKPDNTVIATATLTGSTSSWRLAIDAPGDYAFSISAIDADGLESREARRDVQVAAVRADTPLAVAKGRRGYAVGSRVEIAGWKCRDAELETEPATAMLLTMPGLRQIVCSDTLGRSDQFEMETFPILLELSAPPRRTGAAGQVRVVLPSPEISYTIKTSPGITATRVDAKNVIEVTANANATEDEWLRVIRNEIVVATIPVPIT